MTETEMLKKEAEALGFDVPARFKAWKGALGWSFTAAEERRCLRAKVAAAMYMKSLGAKRLPIR